MGDVQEYRWSEILRAEIVEEDSRVNTLAGVEWAKAGDYLVHIDGGVKIATAEYWERMTEPVTEKESEARKFSPAGKSVETVVEFMKENPDEVDRVKAEEKSGGNRKGITEFRS